jgi:hypothetical protein
MTSTTTQRSRNSPSTLKGSRLLGCGRSRSRGCAPTDVVPELYPSASRCVYLQATGSNLLRAWLMHNFGMKSLVGGGFTILTRCTRQRIWHRNARRLVGEGGVASGQTRRAKAEGSKNEANLKQLDSFREAKQAEASRARPGATTHYPDASYEASPPLSPPRGGRRTRGTSKPDDPDFARFWDAYPRKEAKGAARRAWTKAIKTADADAVIAGAARYRHDPRREERFTAHAATWLNSERWLDQTPTTRAVGDAIGGAFWDN